MNLIDQLGALMNVPFPNAVQALNILLLDAFERYKAHVWAQTRLYNSEGVIGICLVPFAKRRHKLGRNEGNGMAEGLQLSRPIMRSTARLHEHPTGRLAAHKIQDLMPFKLFVDLNTRAASVDNTHLENTLCQIQPYCLMLVHDSSPPH